MPVGAGLVRFTFAGAGGAGGEAAEARRALTGAGAGVVCAGALSPTSTPYAVAMPARPLTKPWLKFANLPDAVALVELGDDEGVFLVAALWASISTSDLPEASVDREAASGHGSESLRRLGVDGERDGDLLDGSGNLRQVDDDCVLGDFAVLLLVLIRDRTAGGSRLTVEDEVLIGANFAGGGEQKRGEIRVGTDVHALDGELLGRNRSIATSSECLTHF